VRIRWGRKTLLVIFIGRKATRHAAFEGRIQMQARLSAMQGGCEMC
jgi:hypothetical protein